MATQPQPFETRIGRFDQLRNRELGHAVVSVVVSFANEALSDRTIETIERAAIHAARQWGERNGYDMTGWCARCLVGGDSESLPVRILGDDGTPILIEGSSALGPDQAAILLRDPFGILVEADCAEWLIRNGWNGWGR